MAPNKFEEHVKEKLDGRELKPSAGSWEKLNSRLDESKKGSKVKWWIPAVAAAIVALIVSMVFVDQQNQFSTPIVETPTETDLPDNSEKRNFEKPVQLASDEKKDMEESILPPTKTKKNPIKRSQSVYSEESEIANQENNNTALKDRDNLEPVITGSNAIAESNTPDPFYEEVKEAVEAIAMNEKEYSDLKEAEVDALLAEAKKKISLDRDLNAEVGFSPNDLLAEAEDEIYQSFKEKIFEVLKDGYQKASVAVTNKLDNNQYQ